MPSAAGLQSNAQLLALLDGNGGPIGGGLDGTGSSATGQGGPDQGRGGSFGFHVGVCVPDVLQAQSFRSLPHSGCVDDPHWGCPRSGQAGRWRASQLPFPWTAYSRLAVLNRAFPPITSSTASRPARPRTTFRCLAPPRAADLPNRVATGHKTRRTLGKSVHARTPSRATRVFSLTTFSPPPPLARSAHLPSRGLVPPRAYRSEKVPGPVSPLEEAKACPTLKFVLVSHTVARPSPRSPSGTRPTGQ